MWTNHSQRKHCSLSETQSLRIILKIQNFHLQPVFFFTAILDFTDFIFIPKLINKPLGIFSGVSCPPNCLVNYQHCSQFFQRPLSCEIETQMVKQVSKQRPTWEQCLAPYLASHEVATSIHHKGQFWQFQQRKNFHLKTANFLFQC